MIRAAAFAAFLMLAPVAAGLRALDGEEGLGNAEGVRECDTDAARADVEAEPGAGHAHMAMIAIACKLPHPTLYVE